MPEGSADMVIKRGVVRLASGRDEYFFVLHGHVRLHDRQGAHVDVVAGQGAVIPGGFEGAFEVLSPVRKHFVVVERPTA